MGGEALNLNADMGNFYLFKCKPFDIPPLYRSLVFLQYFMPIILCVRRLLVQMPT